MEISALAVKELREKTGAGIMECKNALVEADGDQNRAEDILKKRGLAKAAKKAERAVEQGIIETYVHQGRVGVMVEVNCETDFVARNEQFKQLAHDIALQIAAMNPRWLAHADIPAEVVAELTQKFTEETVAEGKPAAMIEKIVAGKLKKHFEPQTLLTQNFIRDETTTIGDLITHNIARIGENIKIRRFVRFELGQSE